jgi:hypothetical protein
MFKVLFLKVVQCLLGWEMVIVMISSIILTAVLMVEIVVDLMSILNTAQNANALNKNGKPRMQQHHTEEGKN